MRGNGVGRRVHNDAMDGGFVSLSKMMIVNGETAGLNTVAHSVISRGMAQASVGRRGMRRGNLVERILRAKVVGYPQKVRRCLQIRGLGPTENKAGRQRQRLPAVRKTPVIY